jgi:hypothetical protein
VNLRENLIDIRLGLYFPQNNKAVNKNILVLEQGFKISSKQWLQRKEEISVTMTKEE